MLSIKYQNEIINSFLAANKEHLLSYERLAQELPEIFKQDYLLELNSDQMEKLLELPFLDNKNFISKNGKFLLWIDWVNDNQMKNIVDILI